MKRELIFKLLFGTAIGLAVAFCLRIDETKNYGWWAGIWQGCLALYHWILSWFNDEILIRAARRTTGYDIWWWITFISNAGAWILVVIRLIIPLKRRSR